MKKQLLLPIFFIAFLGTVSAQSVIIRTYVEKTHMSPKTGTSIGFENRFSWEFGAFFQEASLMESFMMSEDQREALPREYEEEFSGIYFAVPITVREKFVVKANVRTGMTNGENFAITPSILADYKPMKHVRIGMGIGTRSFRPTMQGSISFTF
ncbi:hypothetical protein [Ekhidna sp.]